MEFQTYLDANPDTNSTLTFPPSYTSNSALKNPWKSQTESPDEQHLETSDTTCSSCLIQYTQESSFSGLKYVGQKGNFFRRLFWLLVVLLALSGLSYQIVLSTMKFIERPTNTKFSIKEEDELDFPSVTFCNTNMFRYDKLSTKYKNWLTFLSDGLLEIRRLFPQLGITDSNIEDDIPKYYDGSNGNISDIPEDYDGSDRNIDSDWSTSDIPEDYDGSNGIPDYYAGNVSLYDFIVTNGHGKEDSIKL
ncbi:uncharacterized protein [Amphiura filiformis]|uniref:uncharacterized protein n=1 Tax=Amphiura filiformis TaxID=82378 RepID=UPI003B228C62